MSLTPFDEVLAKVGEGTLSNLADLWADNFRLNLPMIWGGETVRTVSERPDVKRAIIVGRGPSLFKFNHLKTLKEKGFDGTIVSSDGALPELVSQGITPEYVVGVDGNREKIWRFYWIQKWPDRRRPDALLPVTADPKTAKTCEKVGIVVYWWTPMMSTLTPGSTTHFLMKATGSNRNPAGAAAFVGLGCSGNQALLFATTLLRAKEVCLIGMSNGYPPEEKVEKLHYHDAILKWAGGDKHKAAELYRYYKDPSGGFTIVDPVFESYRRAFLNFSETVKGKVRIVNCSGQSCLFAPHVEWMKFETYLDSIKNE